eukprot:NODE_3060_length_384_cov_26.232836_g2978_i0.p2 GENE.NODE_3060_length_384_cov_26.232836_g2978_i0~~NODE_3060_length_384_cov_26.232836_g2978_i0.p2  ORF type:complete len:60 (-),score=11.26 NODE_3060_length_384_cov_26.232836_g2978_i0:81-260(-)
MTTCTTWSGTDTVTHTHRMHTRTQRSSKFDPMYMRSLPCSGIDIGTHITHDAMQAQHSS